MIAEHALNLDQARLQEYINRQKLYDTVSDTEAEQKYKDLVVKMTAQIEEDKKKLAEAEAYRYSVSGTNVGLIAGLTVVILSVCVAGFMIIKKRNDDYWADDENEGGEGDSYKRFVE